MAQTKGRAFLLFISTTAPTTALSATVPKVTAGTSSTAPSATGYALLGSAIERSMTVTNEAIDATVAPPATLMPLWQNQLAGAKAVQIEASGRYVDSSAEEMLEDVAFSERSFARMLLAYPAVSATSESVVVGGGDIYGRTIVGDFLVTNYSSSGPITDTFNWSASLTSVSAVYRT